MENSLVIVPARHAARRFPGKMLTPLNGPLNGRLVSARSLSIAGAGLGWKAAQPPLICQGVWRESWLDDCQALGAGFAAGLSLGVF